MTTPDTADSAQPSAQDSSLTNLTYEQARDQLTAVVEQLEAGTTTLEESLALWERGEQLVGICEQWLDNARQRIEAVRRKAASVES